MKNTIICLFIFSCSVAFSQNWHQIKTVYGGNVYSLAENSEGEIFAAMESGGVYRSADSGKSWKSINNGLENAFAGDIVVAKNNDVLVGTFFGIFRFDESNESWTHSNKGLQDSEIVILKEDKQGMLVASTEFDNIYVSKDNGNNWKLISALHFEDIYALAADSNVIYVGTLTDGIMQITFTDSSSFVMGINNGLPMEFVSAVIEDSSGNIFIGTGVGNIYRSTDQGNSWTLLASIYPNRIWDMVLGSGDGIYAAAYSQGVFYSPDDGDHWTQQNTGLTSPYIISLAGHGSQILAGANGAGVFISENKGLTWTEANTGIIASNITSMILNSYGDIFACFDGLGILRSQDGGNNWVKVNQGIDFPFIISMAADDSGNIVAGTNPYDGVEKVYRSTDNGNTWSIIFNVSIEPTDVRALCFNSKGDLFAATGEGVLKTTDNGNNWLYTDTGVTCPNVECIASNLHDDLFAGLVGCKASIYKSIDNGNHWMESDSGLPPSRITTFAIDRNNNIYAGTASNEDNFYRSTDNGENWVSVNQGIEHRIVATVAFDTNYIYVAGYHIFRSDYSLNGWTEMDSGLNAAFINVLTETSGGYLLAGTEGAGIFTQKKTMTGIDQNIASYSFLDQNYPNPFNKTTTLVYHLSSETHVSLKVYNLLGSEVATLVDDIESSGAHSLPFNSMGLERGIYFYKLKTDHGTETKSMLLGE